MIKIIKTSTYNELLKQQADAESLRTQLFLLRQSAEEERRELLFNCRIRKCIVGKKGIGKTTFLQQKILPQLTNYFVIDTTGEYQYLPAENTYCVDRALSDKFVIEAIKKNAGKTIVLEEPGMVNPDYRWYWDLIKDGNFIIICQSARRIEPILEGIDTIFDFGEFHDISNFNYSQNYKKFVTIGKVTF